MYGNGSFLVSSLLKALFGDSTFSRVKTHDLPGHIERRWCFYTISFFLGEVLLENLFRSLGIVTTGGLVELLLLRITNFFAGFLFSFFFFFVVRL
jgi:hypothetical protein